MSKISAVLPVYPSSATRQETKNRQKPLPNANHSSMNKPSSETSSFAEALKIEEQKQAVMQKTLSPIKR